MLNHFPRPVTLENYRDEVGRSFIEIGFTEDLPLSMQRIAAKLGKPFKETELRHMNQSERVENVPYTLRDAFRARHPLEHAVYDFALKLFR